MREAEETLQHPLICFSHLRWNFVFQRPQHLLTRAARTYRVYFWEEPECVAGVAPHLKLTHAAGNITIALPILPPEMDDVEVEHALRYLLDDLLEARQIVQPLLWYYTPRALMFSGHLAASMVVYDCMDELSAFLHADSALPLQELALLERADVVFTGGFSLYEVKRQQHGNVHPLPSGVDVEHFTPARKGLPDPADQRNIPHPRLGFYGVIDERLDRALVAQLADAEPDWQIILVGPAVKIDQTTLPRRPNIHYLGAKTYDELPAYIGNWEVALMPFALNEATRFISPTKTPEYLAAGRPVVSTAIVDVARHYERVWGVHIARSADEFVACCARALHIARHAGAWRDQADQVLVSSSWDAVWSRMSALIRSGEDERAQDPLGPLLARPAILRGSVLSYDVAVVGAGFAGSVIAERFARTGKRVVLLDRREHIGGNAYDERDAAGLLVHRYGPHIFHTNSSQIIDYLSQYTTWQAYEHKVRARVGHMLLPIPINRTTINRFFGVSLAEAEVADFLATKAVPIPAVRSAEDVVISTVGRELYETFFRGYTRKQWNCDPSELDKSVTARIPTRTNDDDRYFGDKFQVMPRDGYTRMFDRLLDHPNIRRLLSTDFQDVRGSLRWDHLVFTGPIDEYFGYCFGRLPYRSLRFVHETHDKPLHQPVAVVNYPSPEVPYTRVTEFKHLTGQVNLQTSICYEYPQSTGDPYYPIPRPENAALYARYRALADATPGVTFVGRLGTYQYYNMDQVVGQALATFDRLMRRGSRRAAVAGEAVAAPSAAPSS
jgi:UDP-galactopyranose mutase